MLNLELKIIFSKCLDLHIFKIYIHIQKKNLQKKSAKNGHQKEKKENSLIQGDSIL